MLKSELMRQLEYLPDVVIEFTEFNIENGNFIQTFRSASVDKRNVFEKKKDGKTIALVFSLSK